MGDLIITAHTSPVALELWHHDAEQSLKCDHNDFSIKEACAVLAAA
jgi:hypothetical protein